MSLRDELKDISADTVRQALPAVGGALATTVIGLVVARIKQMPERIAMRTARRKRRREARRKARATK
jgi:heme exporter protein D